MNSIPKRRGCREEVLEAATEIVSRKGRNEFTPSDVIDFLQGLGTTYKPSTIRTHVVSRCCVNAPPHHGARYGDFERIAAGTYRILGR